MNPLLLGDVSYVTSKNAKQGAYLAMQYLHAYFKHFDEIPQEELMLAVDAIEDCVRASRLPVQTTVEPLYVTRLLTNCVSKASRKVCGEQILLLDVEWFMLRHCVFLYIYVMPVLPNVYVIN